MIVIAMRKRVDLFYIWLGLTILGIVIFVFLALTRYRADFFRDFAPIL
jgi:hypothetical protein